MPYRMLRSEKCDWQSPYRSGGRLELMEMAYDGRRWYRMIAVGPEMKDNFLQFGIPTNIDHIRNLEDAEDLFEDILKGPNNKGNLTVSRFWSSEKQEGRLQGHTPNLYMDNDLKVNGETVVGCVQSGDSIKTWAGPGGIVILNPKGIKTKANREKISEEAAWNGTIRHEFKHFNDHFQGIRSDEIEALHEGFEASLESGAEIDRRLIVAKLMRYGVDGYRAVDLQEKWKKEWAKKYDDFCIQETNPNLMYLENPWMDAMGRAIREDEERDLSDEDLAKVRGLWDKNDEEEENNVYTENQ